MTDITELAQKRNAAISRLSRAFEPGHSSQSELDALSYTVDVMNELVEALEKAQGMEIYWKTQCRGITDHCEELQARIADLESRTVKLPPVDADVSDRNQPGMVVAVHIDAGDFVKFRDQVYEVKETDFDDHDVTLWFVCGEVLKCAAGCQIEVVSAPVEDE